MYEPANKRAVVFVDGQNLFHAAREAFGYTHPNYDVLALANALCALQAWNVEQVRFYTGIPHASADPFWNHFWTHKLAAMGRQGVVVFSRHLRYRNRSVTLGDGTHHTFLTGEEKGIDVRIALDVISLAHARACAVALRSRTGFRSARSTTRRSMRTSWAWRRITWCTSGATCWRNTTRRC